MKTERHDVPPRVPGRRMRRAAHGLSWLALVVAFVLGALGWALTQGAVVLPAWTVVRIEERIGRDLAPRRLSLGEVALAYDIGAQALRLRLRGASLSEPGGVLVSVPDAWLALDGAALLRGRLRPRAVRVEGLAVDVARDAEGRFALAFGSGGGALPGSWSEALETLDAALATPVVAGLEVVEVSGVTLQLSDAVTGLRETVEDGTATWARDGVGLRLSLAATLDLGGERARLAADLARRTDGDGDGAEAHVAVSDVSLAGLAEVLPGVRALSLVQGVASLEGRMALSEEGEPGPLRGAVSVRDLRMTDRAAMRLDRAGLDFAWQPGSGRIALDEIAASADDLSTTAEGQILLEDGLVGPMEVQLRLGATTLDPEGLFDRRVAFDEGVVTARLTQAPLGFHLGQAVLTGPSGTARLSGRLAFVEGGPQGVMRLDVPRMAVDELLALWPPTMTVGARRWLDENLTTGVARDATGLLRLAPGEPPRAEASFAIEDATLRYMRDMPPIEDATGAAQLSGERFAVRVDTGSVPATGPAGTRGEGRLDVAGTTFAIPDARARPPEGVVDLRVRGSIGDMLTTLDNPPFSLLERLDRDADLATGTAEARVSVRVPLRPGNAPADIGYAVAATLRDVESRSIVPGKRLAARVLSLDVTPALVSVAGDMTLEGVVFSGRWEQALPAPSTTPSDRAAPALPTPVALPAPGRVTGTARLDAAGLGRLGVSVAAVELDGATDAAVSVTLPQGGAPRLSVASDLRGAGVRLPSIGWSKARDRPATFALDATLGSVPEITRVTLDAPGLQAEGRATFRAGGALAEARFDRVGTGWFRGPVALTGRGAGASPGIRVAGGRADLRRALDAVEGGGDGGGPVEIALDRLQVTDGIALTNLRASLRGGAGRFTGQVNDGAQVSGLVGPDVAREGTAVQVSGADAGGVMRSAGLFADGVGGTMAFTLRPTAQSGVYDGAVRMANLRVRNAPALASLLQALSVVGILEQLTGEGLSFPSVEADFTLRPDAIAVRRASAVGPSMSITGDGVYAIESRRIDIQGVISPIYLVNGLFGALFARRDEGLFGFTYRLTGLAANPDVSVNPLSILTPGVFREIFRRPPPS